VAFLFHSVVLEATYIEKKIGKIGLEKDEGKTYFLAFVDFHDCQNLSKSVTFRS